MGSAAMTTGFTKPVTEREHRAVKRMREGKTYHAMVDKYPAFTVTALSFEDAVDLAARRCRDAESMALERYTADGTARRRYTVTADKTWVCVWPPQPPTGGLPVVNLA